MKSMIPLILLPIRERRVVIQRLLWRKAMLFFITTFSFCCLSAQTIPVKPNQTDSKHLRQGEWVLLYDDVWGEVSNPASAFYYRLISYKDEVPQGVVTDFYKNGTRQW